MAKESKPQGMPLERDDESGRYTKSYTPEMVLEAIDDHGGAASTSDVAETIGSSRRLALKRLRELEEDGRVTAREVGNTYLWQRPGGEDE